MYIYSLYIVVSVGWGMLRRAQGGERGRPRPFVSLLPELPCPSRRRCCQNCFSPVPPFPPVSPPSFPRGFGDRPALEKGRPGEGLFVRRSLVTRQFPLVTRPFSCVYCTLPCCHGPTRVTCRRARWRKGSLSELSLTFYLRRSRQVIER